MDDQTCPKCKTTKYRNPAMVLMVNVCGHALCENCVELLFAKGTGSCPECKIAIRRNQFRVQLFEDSAVDKEVDIRKRILKEFNKRQEDFNTLREYNDYLEQVETIIFNLVNDVDIASTNKMIDDYKKANKDVIQRNKNRQSQEEIELEELIEAEKAQQAEKAAMYAKAELEEKKQKHKAKEKLIDELIVSDADAKDIIASHAQAAAAMAKELSKPVATAPPPAVVKSSTFSSGVQIGLRGSKASFAPIPRQEDLPTFTYTPTIFDYNGPTPPSIEKMMKEEKKIEEAKKHNKTFDEETDFYANIRAATEAEKAGGYIVAFSCCRVLQEAMGGLFYVPMSSHKAGTAIGVGGEDEMDTT